MWSVLRVARGWSRGEKDMADERWLIVGLGNPGPGYAGNRHNAGYMVADVLAERMGAHFRAGKFQDSMTNPEYVNVKTVKQLELR